MTLQHIALESDWQAAQAEGSYPISTRGQRIADVGFMHCSTPEQTAGVRERFYSDVTEPLLLLTLDESALAAHGLEVRREPPAPGVAELFPHVYGGDLPVACVAAVSVLR
ncbi:DUF952 domain-containing protein [Janibacter cremeus]|uniref:DUF952 domain-containing protein n=1 Tax=Janibacter cremeus TaxID=1285192 RepID=UPI0023F85FDC|nr:DUF952 domain-containing protein [Janibacter cremeus]WEV77175.1 DUF952 domain-containing protein [Janibacter cremeus]